ncbi:DUF2778 domain-containing protein [Phreatobacter stygius]|uniref:DUF2778 domain-containing protein n=2 Tax=Phreatobacter stygius TaxID=1940610 RepID=A0A4D7BEX8_9HYPH|nr:DUF2778 domain-containing protein [Phreatobacter stygius]
MDPGVTLATASLGFAAIRRHDPLLDSAAAFGPPPRPIGQNLPLQAHMRPATPAPTAVASLPALFDEPELAHAPTIVAALPAEPVAPETARPVPAPAQRPNVVLGAPMPIPRPPELRTPAAPEPPRMAAPLGSRRTRAAAAAAPAAPVDNRNFFERLFGAQPASGPQLAYAATGDAALERPSGGGLLGRAMPGPGPVVAQGTAIYDISARTVYLPNGERLEAHSGLGDKMDDPRHAHVRMHGPTPPHTYALTERERLFHGVRALRLNPVGGSAAIHGRAGLLAHTYLLGPRGDSNGCISFKDYDRFLKAYLRGEVRRLIVVASLR